MKKLIPVLLVAVLAFASCDKDPDMGKLDGKYLVYTNYDKSADFKEFTTYYLPDSILLIGASEKPEYWKGGEAQEILQAYIANLNARGYMPVDNREEATIGIQVSYIMSTYYLASSGQPEWWWNYPGYWGSDYWGNWGGWYYPYAVNYRYSTNSFITEMVDLTAEEGSGKKIPVLWTNYLNGYNYSTNVNKQLVVEAVNQAFKQSPYVTNK